MAVELKTRSVTLDLVEQAGNALVKDNEHFARFGRRLGPIEGDLSYIFATKRPKVLIRFGLV